MHLPIKHQCTHIEIKLWIIINFMHIDILPPNSCTQYMLVYTILNTGLQPSNTVTFHSNISIFDFLPYLLLQHTLNTKYKTQNTKHLQIAIIYVHKHSTISIGNKYTRIFTKHAFKYLQKYLLKCI